jgi:hypothetical protein
MIFDEGHDIVYCKDDFYSAYNDKGFYHKSFYYRSGKEYYKVYYRGYIVHRENGPAIEWSDGRKDWYIDGIKHRKDGPSQNIVVGQKLGIKMVYYIEKMDQL